jgi:hypothetical protein
MGIFDDFYNDLKGSVSDAISDPLGTAAKLQTTYLTGGLDYIFNALKPEAPPDYNIGAQPILVNIASNIAPINVVYGSRKVGGTRIFADVTGATNEYLHMIIVLCEGEVQAINTVYLDDIPTTDPKFSGFVTVEKFLGSDTQAACATLIAALPSKWTANHRGLGIAYVYMQLKYDRTVFPKGLPVVTADVDGKQVWNAATSTTEFSHNPAWCIRDYITNTRYGRGLSASLIDDAGFIAAASYCNTQVAIPYTQQFNVYNKGSGVNVANNTLTWLSALGSARAIMGADEGKYYWEVTIGAAAIINIAVGIATSAANLNAAAYLDTHTLVYHTDYLGVGAFYYNGVPVQFVTALAPGVVVGIALDANAHTVTFYRNNVQQGTPVSITSEIWLPLMYIGWNTDSMSANFVGTHVYALPSGYVKWPQTQRLYTCDGMLNVNDTAYNNTKALLTSCRGDIKFTGGLYRLVIDKAETPAFTFNEDNITGSWSIGLPGRKDKYNRVVGMFYNPYLNWQPDPAIQQSATYTAQDGGRVSEKKYDLPFTTDIYRAQHIIQQDMKKSRFGTVAQFTALPEGLRCESGDVVYLTHTTPGWVNKPFRIASIDLKSDDEVSVTVKEYDPAIYTLDALVVVPTVGISTLPNPFVTVAPGTPVIVGELYQTSGSAGVKTRAIVTCYASPDIYVTAYSLEFRKQGAAYWIVYAFQSDRRWEVPDLIAGYYEARVRSINSMGVYSAYSATTTTGLQGLTALPSDVTNFTLKKVSGVAVGSWSLSPDLDVRIGGRIVVRQSALTTGATWNDGYVIEEFNGDAVSGIMDLITGTYMVKARDSSGNYSANMASFVMTEGMITGFTTVGTSTQAATFTGTKTNLSLVGSALQLTDPAASLTGEYLFSTYLDLTTVATRRFESDITVYSFTTTDLIDSRTDPIDTWAMFDGGVINDTDVTLYAALTNDNPAGTPTWSDWTPFFVSDFTCRAIKFKLLYSSLDVTHNIACTTLTVHAKIPA